MFNPKNAILPVLLAVAFTEIKVEIPDRLTHEC